MVYCKQKDLPHGRNVGEIENCQTRDGLFALRVAVTVSTAAVPTLPFTRRHFLRGVSE